MVGEELGRVLSCGIFLFIRPAPGLEPAADFRFHGRRYREPYVAKARPRTSPKTRAEAFEIYKAHGIEVLQDFARADPNPNSVSALFLEDLARQRATKAAVAHFHVEPAVIAHVSLGDLKTRNASIRVNCRAFACWKVTDIPAREINAPDDVTDLKSLHFFGLKCPHCKCAFMMLSVV
jgi:hypothetical protein